jgi:hypothetical protein
MRQPGQVQVFWCFGGGGSQPAPPPPPAPTNTPVERGSDSFQRFQEIRKGLLTGTTQLIQNPTDDTLGGTVKGSTIAVMPSSTVTR